MRVGSKARPELYRALELLREVPLHDVWEVLLPGGGPDRTVDDVRVLMSMDSITQTNPVVRALFALRSAMGSVFGWDREPEPQPGLASGSASEPEPSSERAAGQAGGSGSYLERIPDEIRARSTVAPGSKDGIFTVLYALDREMVSEARNATVHAFSVFALEPVADGYRLIWAIYVAPTGPLTPFYMALIAPFRRFLVYPAILRSVRRGVGLSEEAGRALERIRRSAEEPTGKVGEIVRASESQSRDIEAVDEAMSKLRGGIDQITVGTYEQDKVASELLDGVEQLRQLAREVKGATSEQSRQSGHMAHAVEGLAAGVNQILTSAETQHSEVAVILQALEVFRENTVESSRRADALAERVESLSNRADELGTGVGRFTL